MGVNKLLKAEIIETGQKVDVYMLKNGNYCNYQDCKTQYKPNTLKIN